MTGRRRQFTQEQIDSVAHLTTAEAARKLGCSETTVYRYRPKQKPIIHGTIHAYQDYVCRCEECTEAWASYQRVQHGGSPPLNPGRFKVVRSTGNGLAGLRYHEQLR